MRTVCGLDVHKDSIFGCILRENGEQIEKEYDVLTPSLFELRDDLLSADATEVAMESTSIYWVPILRTLSPHFDLTLANPVFIKQMAGRKSDQADAAWIAELQMNRYIKKSYIPNEIVQEMRPFHRRYADLRKDKVRLAAKTDNLLQRCNIRISNYIANANRSKSYQKVITCLLAGETSPGKLADCIHGRIRNKHGEKTIVAALTGTMLPGDLVILRQYERTREMFEQDQQECLAEMQSLAETYFSEELELLKTMPGMKEVNPLAILAEIGADMSAFEKASKLVGWAGFRPRNDTTAGKIKSRKILKGNKYLRQALIQIAWSAVRTKGSLFQTKYQLLLRRHMPDRKALIAIARKILIIIWHILKEKQKYDPTKQIIRACLFSGTIPPEQ